MELFWFIPTGGDGRYLGTTTGSRATNAGYLRQLAQAIDHLGYTGALLPTGSTCEDAWIVASTLVPVTQRMKFLVAVRPGLMEPAIAARMTTTLDRLSGGRLLVNVVAGGDPIELAADGLHLSHDERYAVTDEFLTIWRGLMRGEDVTLEGQYHKITDGHLALPPVQTPYPPLYFGGSSPAAHSVAARHADVYLTWGEPPAQVAEKLEDMRQRAIAAGRTIRFGIRMHIIVRETEEQAWAAAEQLIQYVDEQAIARAQQLLGRYDSHGQQRMRKLHGSTRDDLEISPNLWAGIGLVRNGAGTALVGDPETVVARLREYADLGIDTFILSGYPHLEEAYRVAELVFPLLGKTQAAVEGGRHLGLARELASTTR